MPSCVPAPPSPPNRYLCLKWRCLRDQNWRCFFDRYQLCYLLKDHPDFDRLHRTLRGVAGTETPVLFATHSHPVDDEEESWWHLLDARRADTPIDVPGDVDVRPPPGVQ